MRAIPIAGVVALALLGCGIGDQGAYDQRGGPAIAEHIRRASSPIVQEVAYNPGDYMDAATIDIILRPGVGADEARAFICDVAVPAMASGEPPDSLGIAAWDATSTRIVASDLDACPSQSQPSN
jgi:hypothetical protein